MFDIAYLKAIEDETFRLVCEETLWEAGWSDHDLKPYLWRICLVRNTEQNGHGERRVRYAGSISRDVTTDGEDWVVQTLCEPSAAKALARITEYFWELVPANYCAKEWEAAREDSALARTAYDEALAEEALCAVNLAQTLQGEEGTNNATV